MSLMDAKEYDPRPAQRRWRIIGALVLLAAAVAVYLYLTRYNSEKAVINKLFTALEQKDFEKAYGIYHADPDWKQHPEKYSAYTLGQFTLDYGPSSEYGVITSHHVDCALKPKSNASGVVVVVTINHRAEPHSMWVETKSKAITDPSPVGNVLCHGQQ
ncbi:MAG TPA: hypothetical protein VFR84_03865 [Candidatus Angelobacter sp.]|nr:hypothetical protein [Candidatus Angelobacter sp.]